MINHVFEVFRLKKNKLLRNLFSNFRKKKLKNLNFTIISNNCWGGTIYESYNLPKQTPTVGLFFEADDYIKFISNLKLYLNKKIKFIEYDKSTRYKKGINEKCIVGKLNDIEIYFLHYSSEKEVLDKWYRRIKRINYDKILYKFNDQNGCTQKNVEDFFNLPLKNKIFFTVNEYFIDNDRVVKFKKIPGEKTIMTSQEPFGKSKYINITELINDL